MQHVHEMNANRAYHVCLSILRMIQLMNYWTHLNEIRYGRYFNGTCLKIVDDTNGKARAAFLW
jgi:hypothetical protein